MNESSLQFMYRGPALQERTLYTWRVAWRDAFGKQSIFSDPAFFVTAGTWNAPGVRPPHCRFFLFRQVIKLPQKKPELIILKLSSTPYPRLFAGHWVWFNNQLCAIGPGRGLGVLYETRDITGICRPGINILCARCSCPEEGLFSFELDLHYRKNKTHVIQPDQSSQIINADAWYNPTGACGLLWEQDKSYLYYNHPQEHICAANEPENWKEAESPLKGWDSPLLTPFKQKPKPVITEPVVWNDILPRTQNEQGEKLTVDFGKEFIGTLKIGQSASFTLDISLAEEIHPDGKIFSPMRTGNKYYDSWTALNGKKNEHHEYRCFRYAEIKSTDLKSIHVSAREIHAPFNDNDSYFTCSDSNLVRIWNLCRDTIHVTTLDYYTDSETRERGVYEGDALINALADYTIRREYRNARASFLYLLEHPTWPSDWRLCIPMILYEDFMQTGDREWLKLNYTKVLCHTYEKYCNAQGLIEKKPQLTNDSGLPWDADLVDWPPSCRDGYIFTEINTVLNAYQYRCFVLFSEMSRALNLQSESVAWQKKADALFKSFNNAFFDGEKYTDGQHTPHTSLHANLFTLSFGLVPINRLQSTVDFIKTKRMKCGVYPAYFLLDGLYSSGQAEYAYSLLTGKGICSWLHMLDDLKCTLTAESWDPSFKPNMTFSHPWATGPLPIIRRRIMGITAYTPGSRIVHIQPHPGPLTYAKIRIPIPAGNIETEFNITHNEMMMHVSLPGNTEALVEPPTGWYFAAQKTNKIQGEEIIKFNKTEDK